MHRTWFTFQLYGQIFDAIDAILNSVFFDTAKHIWLKDMRFVHVAWLSLSRKKKEINFNFRNLEDLFVIFASNSKIPL